MSDADKTTENGAGDDELLDYDPADFRPGTFGCHEALHTTSIVMDLIETSLVDHPSIATNPKWVKLTEEAYEKLAELYAGIGEAHLDASDEEN